MGTFMDSEGQAWHIELDDDAIFRIGCEARIDLMGVANRADRRGFRSLLDATTRVVEILAAALEPEAHGRGITGDALVVRLTDLETFGRARAVLCTAIAQRNAILNAAECDRVMALARQDVRDFRQARAYGWVPALST